VSTPLLPDQSLGLVILLLLILVDVVIAYVQAVRARVWNWSRAGAFTEKVLYRIGGLIAAAVVANTGPTSLQALTQPAWWGAAVAVAANVVLGDIAAKVHGLQAPSSGQDKAG